MTVVELAAGGLWLHSPVAIDETLGEQIESLGAVRHIVAPNCFHHEHAAAAKKRFPEAELWGAPGLTAKRPDVAFDAVLDGSDDDWSGTLESVFIDGFPKMNETVFFHVPSDTLICADFLFNINEENHALTRLFWRGFGVWKRVAQNRAWRLMRKDKLAAAKSARRVLEWDIHRITLAHGDVIESGGHAKLVHALRWLTSER
jgi:hypothetical protein